MGEVTVTGFVSFACIGLAPMRPPSMPPIRTRFLLAAKTKGTPQNRIAGGAATDPPTSGTHSPNSP